MKQRFSSLDVKVISLELSKSLVSLRVANIYDLSSRIFLFKLAKPGARQQLLVDAGFRCHLTGFTRTTAAAPSAFVSRLRKYLKSRRITSVTQIGTDRVIEISFSDGQYRLFLEFFAAGNLVLTDKDLNVLALFRQVSEGDEDVDVKLGSTYSVKAKQNFLGIPPLTRERVRETLSNQIQRTAAAAAAGTKKRKGKGGDDLRKAVSSGFSEYPAHLLDHAFRAAAFDPLLKPELVLEDDEQISRLMTALEIADKIFRSLGASGENKGYIIAKAKVASSKEDFGIAATPPQGRDQLLYDDFHPFRPSQFEDKPEISILEFKGYNRTVDEFYSSLESQKLESKLTEREENARRKLENARLDHEKRVGALQEVQELHIRKAQAIEANTHRVEEAIAAVNGLIGQGMDWVDIAKLIENEKSRQNAVAQMIKLPLKLYENTVTLLLDEGSNEDDDVDDADEAYDTDGDEGVDSDAEAEKATNAKQKTTEDKRLAIDIDLALSPWSNARQYYDQKKTAAVKEQKTIQASTMALKSTEKKISADLKKGLQQEKQSLRPARRPLWFEKFFYFISSDGYLVLGGKDAQQNETLYRKYLKKGDLYVHADLPGAASVIVKNMISSPDAPIPPSTLSQAGALSVCTSSAWDSKAVMAAWWVNADQVSKTAPTGEYLTTGGFIIRGKKNFLPPSQLLLGFAVMFQISEDSKKKHLRHRTEHTENGPADTVTMDTATDGVEDLSVQDQHEDDPVSAQEDNLDDMTAVEETPEPEAAHAEIEEEEDDDDDDDVSAAGSDEHRTQSNPLQNERTRPGTASPIPEEHDDEDQSADESSSEEGHESDAEEPDATANPKPSTSVQPSNLLKASTLKTKQTPAPRGKRTKAKKAAKKYAEQDEEDRILAMQLLGSQKAQEKKAVVTQDKATRDAKLAADKERRRAQHDKAAQAERIKQQKMAASAADGGPGGVAAAEEEADNELLEQERLELANLDALVGNALPGDEILAAIPVVAPWNSLARYKYKVKLQPGAMKKGKAVREIVGRWNEAGKVKVGGGGGGPGSASAAAGGPTKLNPKVVDESAQDRERIWPRELEVIRAWRIEEVIGCVPVGKVRVVQSGAGGAGGGGGGSGGAGAGGKGKGRGGGSGGRGGRGSKRR